MRVVVHSMTSVKSIRNGCRNSEPSNTKSTLRKWRNGKIGGIGHVGKNVLDVLFDK
jgi:hypothetical protein